MRQIDNLSDDASQQVQVILDDGTLAVVALRYLASGQRWVADVTRGEFSVKSIGLCQHPNLLRAYRQVIPFGLMCSAVDDVDPAYIQDWVNGRCSLQILTAEEVQAVETDVIGAPS